MPRHIIASFDPALRARLRWRRPLLYSHGPDPDADRPAHVRAGSGLAWLGDRLAVIQDDANFVALLSDLRQGGAEAVALPRGEGGRRLFDEGLGNKAHKLDLEACVTAGDVDGQPWLVAFGSGSTDRREHVALVRVDKGPPEVRLVHAWELYGALRRSVDFCGSELNIEGAALVDDSTLRLFQRGNGAPCGDLLPLDATCDLPWPQLWAYLKGEQPHVPAPGNVIQYDLGRAGGVRLTFTDATVAQAGLLYLAGAEDSPDTVLDGEVTGAALGIIHAGVARWTPLCDDRGVALVVKAEGLALHPADPRRALVVIDADDPAAPAELLELELSGPWW